jgi:3-hydroxybutyryl-CoA dehydrogenase
MGEHRLSYENLPAQLRARVPGFERVYDEHVGDYGTVLPHVLLGDLVRFLAGEVQASGADSVAADEAVRLMEQAAASGDPRLAELVSVSFLENLDEDDEMFPAVRRRFGPHLAEELRYRAVRVQVEDVQGGALMAGTLAVVGAGLMGSGIAQVAAQAGWRVTLRDLDDATVRRGVDGIRGSLEKFAAKGKISADDVEAALGRITATTDLDAAADADIVVEAVFEKIEIKHEVFRELDRICADRAVLATNTSAIPITTIAAATQRPESVVGTHFFSPVPMMKLCELVRGLKTSDGTLVTAKDFAEQVGKTCVVVNRDVAGFVTTRLIAAFVVEAVTLVESGVISAEDLDKACQLGFGHAMGPLATTDLTGVDVLLNASRNIYDDTADEKFFPPELLQRMVAAGDLGRKSGRGFYSYG